MRGLAMRVAAAKASDYWIGIMGTPVDPLLKSHLKLDAGVVVQQVVPDSPADKAGIREGDILLRFNDAQIRDVLGLAEAVAKNQDKEAKITLLREGKEQTLAITPARRPEPLPVPPAPRPMDWARFREWMQKLERGEIPEDPFEMWFVQPGFVLPKQWKDWHWGMPGSPKATVRLPENTSVTITKPEKGPAKIVVNKDGKTWEVTEDQMDTLPEDVQQIVKDLLGSGFAIVLPGHGDAAMWFDWQRRPFKRRLRPAPSPDEPQQEAEHQEQAGQREQAAGGGPDRGRVDAVRKKLDALMERFRQRQEEMERELEKMRQQLDRLKKTEV